MLTGETTWSTPSMLTRLDSSPDLELRRRAEVDGLFDGDRVYGWLSTWKLPLYTGTDYSGYNSAFTVHPFHTTVLARDAPIIGQ